MRGRSSTGSPLLRRTCPRAERAQALLQPGNTRWTPAERAGTLLLHRPRLEIYSYVHRAASGPAVARKCSPFASDVKRVGPSACTKPSPCCRDMLPCRHGRRGLDGSPAREHHHAGFSNPPARWAACARHHRAARPGAGHSGGRAGSTVGRMGAARARRAPSRMRGSRSFPRESGGHPLVSVRGARARRHGGRVLSREQLGAKRLRFHAASSRHIRSERRSVRGSECDRAPQDVGSSVSGDSADV